jgi:hypothetical protein
LAATDYVPLFLFPVFWLILPVLRWERRVFLKLVISHLPLVIAGFAWLPMFWVQMQKGQWLLATLPAWRDVAGRATVKQAALVWVKFLIGRISFDNKIIYAIVVVLASLPVALTLFRSWIKRKRGQLILWAWLFAPLLLGFLVSFFIPAFSYFRFLFVLPAFYLLAAWGTVSWEKWGKVALAGVLAVNLFSWGIYATQERFQREDWRSAVSFVEKQATSGDIVLFEFSEPFAPYRWYATGKVPAFGALLGIRAGKEDEEKVKELVRGKKGVYHFTYLKDLSDSEEILGSTLAKEGFYQERVYNFRGIGQVVYWQKVDGVIND